jgi:putative colanic acid biosynthesis glycosyltransferase
VENSFLFSIITVAKNNLPGLQKTCASLIQQTNQQYQWIIIDGNSADGSREWLKTKQTHWISEPDAGLYHAMNKGIKRAQAPYILFLNSGDTLANTNVLENIAHLISPNQHPDLIYGDSIEELSSRRSFYKPAKPHTTLPRGMFTHHQSIFYRRALTENLAFNTEYKIAADYDFTARFLEKAHNISYYPYPVCVFEQGGLSQTNAHIGRHEENLVRKRLGLCSDLYNNLVTLRQVTAQAIKTHCPALYLALKKHTDAKRPNPAIT